jgi:hypothetical protein
MPVPKSWVQHVMANYTSTDPPKRVFTYPADLIADAGDVQGVAPKGLTSWQRMVLFHMNRGGKRLPQPQKTELQKAIKILSERRKQRLADVDNYEEDTLLPKQQIDPVEFGKRLGVTTPVNIKRADNPVEPGRTRGLQEFAPWTTLTEDKTTLNPEMMASTKSVGPSGVTPGESRDVPTAAPKTQSFRERFLGSGDEKEWSDLKARGQQLQKATGSPDAQGTFAQGQMQSANPIQPTPTQTQPQQPIPQLSPRATQIQGMLNQSFANPQQQAQQRPPMQAVRPQMPRQSALRQATPIQKPQVRPPAKGINPTQQRLATQNTNLGSLGGPGYAGLPKATGGIKPGITSTGKKAAVLKKADAPPGIGAGAGAGIAGSIIGTVGKGVGGGGWGAVNSAMLPVPPKPMPTNPIAQKSPGLRAAIGAATGGAAAGSRAMNPVKPAIRPNARPPMPVPVPKKPVPTMPARSPAAGPITMPAQQQNPAPQFNSF